MKRPPLQPIVKDEDGILPICEVCNCSFCTEDLEDDVTIAADCCGRIGLCAKCRKVGNHECDDPPAPNEEE
jgi:hypothetical protein